MMNASSQETSANGFFPEDYWNPERSRSNIAHETSKSCEGYDQEDARNKHDHHGTFIQSNNSSNLPCLLNNVVPNSSFLKWDPSNLSLSRFGSYGSVSRDQHHDTDLLYPSLGSPPQTQSYFPSHDHRAGDDQFDPKQLNFQMLSSSTSSSSANFTPFHLSMNPKLFSSEDDAGHGLNK
ncbi:hypothetical protein QVD17_04739 [Tagetes erecta]|uniref:Uncharacterized protein n=1 Tax=Tagetes erecta TaxID=13708 RepID=A0AAD8LH95_TARER|nr:hypothetical protein QVD17_04739 [Tagetes erecta]